MITPLLLFILTFLSCSVFLIPSPGNQMMAPKNGLYISNRDLVFKLSALRRHGKYQNIDGKVKELFSVIGKTGKDDLNSITLVNPYLSPKQSMTLMSTVKNQLDPKSLTIKEATFMEDSVRLLSEAMRKGKLEKVELDNVKLKDNSVLTLIESLKHSNVRHLTLDRSQINSQTASKLPGFLDGSKLEALSLKGDGTYGMNRFGIEAFAREAAKRELSLQSLDFRGQMIDPRTVDNVARFLSKSKIEKIYMDAPNVKGSILEKAMTDSGFTKNPFDGSWYNSNLQPKRPISASSIDSGIYMGPS